MAYVLGLIFADGAVEDVRKSSRTCYLAFGSNDRALLEDVRNAMSSNHNIYFRPPKICTFRDGKRSYLSSESWILRIGSKLIYDDLLNLGLTPRKSLTLKFPKIPNDYLSFFIRGYFDGDGCVMVSIEKGKTKPYIKVIFTCGSKRFLDALGDRLESTINITKQSIHFGGHAFRVRYRKRNSLKLLKFMYKDLNKAPYLDRKHKIYQNYLKSQN